jgi:hypothetical protein
MKTPIIALACAALASFAFLACEDSIISPHRGGCALKTLSKTCNESRCWYDESDGSYFLPYDHNRVSINESVKEWMEEQLASESNDTMLFVVIDFFIHENYVNTLDIDGLTEREYYIDGVRVTLEEYTAAAEKNEEYRQERAAIGKRDLPIPEGIMGVPMTAKQIVELTENYKEIAIEFYLEATIPELGGNADRDVDDDYNRPDC